MRKIHPMLAIAAALLVSVSGCQADREATEGVPLDKNEAIEEAPAAPIPPVGIPVGRDTVSDTATVNTVDLDTIGAGADTMR